MSLTGTGKPKRVPKSNQVSFVDRLIVHFQESKHVQSTAIATGDVDNDSANELVVGGIGGELAIYKGCKLNPWRVSGPLGTVSKKSCQSSSQGKLKTSANLLHR